METMYEARGLKKWYGGKPALNGVEFAVQPGRLVGLLGPNGAGKTTLLKISAGLLTPSAGEVRIAGQLPGPATKGMALPREQRAEDMVAFYKDFYTDFDGYKAGQMLADLKLDPRQRIGAMSKGTQEKLQLCLVMSRAAGLYLLDEPLGGVDPAAREYILSTILSNYSESAAVIISTHLIGDIEKALDEVIVLKDGAVLTHQSVDALREVNGKSVDEYFREVFKC